MRKHISALVAMMLAGAMAMFALAFTSTSASAAEVEYSTDPANPTLVEEVPEGFTALGDPTVTEDNCITTTVQNYSRTTEGAEGEVQTTDWLTEPPEGEGWEQIDQRTVTDVEAVPDSYTEWSAWTETQSGLLEEPTVPANTDTHEYNVTGPVKVVDAEAVAGFWANFQPNDAHAPFVGPPSYPTDPRGSWITHTTGGPGQDQSGVYNIGNPHKGGNWFYRQQAVEEQSHLEWAVEERTREFIPGSDAVTHEEFRYQRTLAGGEDITEYVYTSAATGEPCEEEPPTEEPPTEEPPVEEPPVNTPPVTDTPNVPTSIDAGLSGPTVEQDDTMRAGLLVGSGLLVMLAAGLALTNQRRSGTEK